MKSRHTFDACDNWEGGTHMYKLKYCILLKVTLLQTRLLANTLVECWENGIVGAHMKQTQRDSCWIVTESLI